MPDISMCKNDKCPSKEECYRFRAVPNPERQAYGGFSLDESEKKCDYFMSILKSDKLTPKTKLY